MKILQTRLANNEVLVFIQLSSSILVLPAVSVAHQFLAYESQEDQKKQKRKLKILPA